MYDIAISFDTTGSMRPAIAEVRRRLQESIGVIFEQLEDVRISVMAHGDYCDGARMFSALDFTNNINAVKDFIEKAPNTHGGDAPEMYEYVLYQANHNLSWREGSSKVLICIGDDFPHDSGYTKRYASFAIDWVAEAYCLREHGVKIYAVQALDYGSDRFWNDLAYIGGGKHVRLYQLAEVIEAIVAIAKQQDNTLDEYAHKLTLNVSLRALLDSLQAEPNPPGSFEYGRHSEYSAPRKISSAPSRYHEPRTGRYASEKGLVPVNPAKFQRFTVDYPQKIADFVRKMGMEFAPGRGFYQLVKKSTVQEYKDVVLVDEDGNMYSGPDARNAIGVPYGERADVGGANGTVTIDGVRYKVFIQSTSYTRKLLVGQEFMYEVE